MIINRWISEDDQEKLFLHTEKLRERRRLRERSEVTSQIKQAHGLQQQHDASIAVPFQPKTVAFALFDGSNTRARLPMRVQIFPHDTTDSIVTTVKNFYGLYNGATTGVSFEDERGNSLIVRYENLRNNMVVYVRVIPNYSQTAFQHGARSEQLASAEISVDSIVEGGRRKRAIFESSVSLSYVHVVTVAHH